MVGRNPDPQSSVPSGAAREAGGPQLNTRLSQVQGADTHLDIARRLLQDVGGTDQRTDDALAEASDQVCDKLRLYLSDVLGASGYRILLVRAIAAARVSPRLTLGDDDHIRGPSGSALRSYHSAAVAATLASLFGLLASIVGENLVLRLIHQAWPDFVLLPPFTRRNEAD